MEGRPPRFLAVLAVAAALTTACGSTVPYSTAAQQANNGGALNNGLNAPTPGGLGASAGPLGVGSGTGGAVSGPGALAPTSGPSSAAACCASVNVPSTGSPRGVTATTIKLGFVYDPNADSVNSAVGVGAISHGDDRADTLAIVKDINKHGGIAGRKVVPVFAPFNSESTQTLDQQWSVVCQTFIHDDPVFAALTTPGPGGDALYRQCLAQAGIPLISEFLPVVGDGDFASDPTYVEMGSPSLDRLAKYQVTALQEQHYFTPWNTVSGQPAPTGTVKVGVLTYSDPIFSHAVNTYLVPELRRLGYNPVVETVAQLGSTADLGAQASAVKAAQLAFAANGVTHVIPFEENGGLSTFFMPTARTQNYFPRYGVSTAAGSEALLEAGAADASQYRGAVGFGWIPDLDLRQQDNSPSGPYSNAARRQCLSVMHGAGITFTSGNAEQNALAPCAQLYVVRQALGTAHVDFTVASLLSSLAALGTSYQPAGSLGVDFRPGVRDVASKAYFWDYVDSCSCFRYTGKPVTIP